MLDRKSVVLGRDVSLADTALQVWPVVIGSDLARMLWGSAHPIGQTLLSADRDSIRMTVVGVYDAKFATSRPNESMRVYTAHGKEWAHDAILIRARGPAEPLVPELRRLIRERAPGIPLSRILTLARRFDEERREGLAISGILGSGGGVALLLACLGLYGVIALSVRQRTREIGIRIALGATPARVTQMILASGLRLSAVALAIGLPLSMAMMRFALSQAANEIPKVNEWLIGAVVATTLVAVAAVATWLPARRASLVDPATTLRVD